MTGTGEEAGSSRTRTAVGDALRSAAASTADLLARDGAAGGLTLVATVAEPTSVFGAVARAESRLALATVHGALRQIVGARKNGLTAVEIDGCVGPTVAVTTTVDSRISVGHEPVLGYAAASETKRAGEQQQNCQGRRAPRREPARGSDALVCLPSRVHQNVPPSVMVALFGPTLG